MTFLSASHILRFSLSCTINSCFFFLYSFFVATPPALCCLLWSLRFREVLHLNVIFLSTLPFPPTFFSSALTAERNFDQQLPPGYQRRRHRPWCAAVCVGQAVYAISHSSCGAVHQEASCIVCVCVSLETKLKLKNWKTYHRWSVPACLGRCGQCGVALRMSFFPDSASSVTLWLVLVVLYDDRQTRLDEMGADGSKHLLAWWRSLSDYWEESLVVTKNVLALALITIQ